MKRTYLAATAIAAAFILWVLSGQLGGPDSTGPAPSLAEARARETAVAEDAPVRVRAQILQSQPISAEVVVRGRTAVERFVDVRSETRGHHHQQNIYRVQALEFRKMRVAKKLEILFLQNLHCLN